MKKTIIFLVVVSFIGGIGGWYYFFRQVTTIYADEADHFKYGSIGLEEATGIPYEIWKVMPEVCSDVLPGKDGWNSFGFLWEEGQELPVGISKKVIGMERVGINCASCHAGSYRVDKQSPRVVVLGAPTTSFDVQAYTRFFGDCVNSDNFTSNNVLAAIEKQTELSFIEKLLTRYLVIPVVKNQIKTIDNEFAWFDDRPDQGPGRVDTYGQAKYRVFYMEDDGIAGSVDHPAAWNQQVRDGFWLHWDGNNNSYEERNIAIAIAVAGGNKVDEESIRRVGAYLWEMPVPKYPLGINASLASDGESIYAEQCADCHAVDGSQVGQVVDIDQIGTDRGRLDAFSQDLMDRISGLTYDDTPFFKYYRDYRKTNGYVNGLLDGIWLRGPYLHNGSVPSLWDLLQPEDQRPTTFYRAIDIIDSDNVGFISKGPDAEDGFWYDTRLQGNGNSGHLYGTDLSDAEKWALIEYLKTL
jgi:hypothetical protein